MACLLPTPGDDAGGTDSANRDLYFILFCFFSLFSCLVFFFFFFPFFGGFLWIDLGSEAVARVRAGRAHAVPSGGV